MITVTVTTTTVNITTVSYKQCERDVRVGEREAALTGVIVIEPDMSVFVGSDGDRHGWMVNHTVDLVITNLGICTHMCEHT